MVEDSKVGSFCSAAQECVLDDSVHPGAVVVFLTVQFGLCRIPYDRAAEYGLMQPLLLPPDLDSVLAEHGAEERLRRGLVSPTGQ